MKCLPLTLALILSLIALACGESDHEAEQPLSHLCTELQGEYLDFYFDDLRARQPDLWSRTLATCRETCPQSAGCAPVRSVASWYGDWPDDPREDP